MRSLLDHAVRVAEVEGPNAGRAVLGMHKPRKPRVASEKSDIAYLLAALSNLAELVTQDVLGMPGSAGPAKQYPLLRSAIWTAREAAIRVTKNAREREARAKAKR